MGATTQKAEHRPCGRTVLFLLSGNGKNLSFELILFLYALPLFRNPESSIISSPETLESSLVSRTDSYRRARPEDTKRRPASQPAGHKSDEGAKKKMFGFF
jgi:hypothetical protein